MKKIILSIVLFVGFVFQSLAGQVVSKVVVPDHVIDEKSLDYWGVLSKDDDIYKFCNEFLIKQFGKEWASRYTPSAKYGIKRIHVIHVPHNYGLNVVYNFLGPDGLANEVFLYFFLDDSADKKKEKIEFDHGGFLVMPYKSSELLTPEQAGKIAKAQGYDIHFDKLQLIPTRKMLGKLFLYAPGYWGETGYDEISVNATDGVLIKTMKPIPVAR